jgi:hypothetical protein
MGWVTVANSPGFLRVTKARYYPEYMTFGGYTVQAGSDTWKE